MPTDWCVGKGYFWRFLALESERGAEKGRCELPLFGGSMAFFPFFFFFTSLPSLFRPGVVVASSLGALAPL